MRSTSLIAIGPSSSRGGHRHPEQVHRLLVAVVRRPVQQSVLARHRQQHPDVVLARPVQELAGARLVRSGEVRRDRLGVQILGEADEVGGDVGVCRVALRARHVPAALPQLGPERALAIADVVAHTGIVGWLGWTHVVHHHQGGHPRRRDGNPVPSGHEGDAEGDAAGRRQAGDPVRGGGGGRRRPHRRAHDHRPQQDRAREPLRPGGRAGGAAAAQGRHRPSREGQLLQRARRGALPAPGRPEGTRPRRAAGADARRAASRSRCCWATT